MAARRFETGDTVLIAARGYFPGGFGAIIRVDMEDPDLTYLLRTAQSSSGYRWIREEDLSIYNPAKFEASFP